MRAGPADPILDVAIPLGAAAAEFNSVAFDISEDHIHDAKLVGLAGSTHDALVDILFRVEHAAATLRWYVHRRREGEDPA